LSVVDVNTGVCRHYTIPVAQGGTVPRSHTTNNTNNTAVPSSYSRVVVSGSLNEELLAIYCRGRSTLHFLHVDDGNSRFDTNQGDHLYTMTLPFPIFNLQAVSRELWLLQKDEGANSARSTTYYVLQFGPRVTHTRLCPIQRQPSSTDSPLLSPVHWLSTTATRIEGRAVPSGMNDRLFRHMHSTAGAHAHVVPGLGAALGAMRGGRVPIFTYPGNPTGTSPNSHLPATVLYMKQSQQLVTCTAHEDGPAQLDVVSVQEGVVRRVSVPINAPLPEDRPGTAGIGQTPSLPFNRNDFSKLGINDG
jgi:hypothetical protein